MKRKRGTVPAIVCPECGARFIREQKQPKRRRRGLGGRSQQLEFAAPAPFQHSAATVGSSMPVIAAHGSPVSLEPGQARTVEQIQPETGRNIGTYVLRGFAIGGGLCLISVLAVPLGAPWHTPVWVLAAGSGAGILLSVFSPKEWVVALIEDALQRDIDGDGQAGKPVPYCVEGTLRDHRGNELYLKFDLADKDAAHAWHQFCRAVADGRNFSGREAKTHGLSEQDWTRIYRAFTAQQWARPAGERGTPKLSPTGRAWVRQFASTPPPA